MITTKNKGSNYLARVIVLGELRKHSNADRLLCANILGCNVITGQSAKSGGFYVYFPADTKINADFLSYSNSFKDKMLNANQSIVGYFDKNCKTRALKLRGEISNGYIVPVAEIEAWLTKNGYKNISLTNYENKDFDTICGILLCEKFIQKQQQKQTKGKSKNKKNEKRFNKVIPDNFYFHSDTPHLARNLHILKPGDNILISNKYHGTSAHIRRILCKRKLTLKEKVARFFGIKVDNTYYDLVYGSRCVVKNSFEAEHTGTGYYNVDVWAAAANKLQDKLKDGLSIFCEIVGYLPGSTSMIQKGYDYGCDIGEFKILVYRMTYTSPTGVIYEFTWPQIKVFCNDNKIEHVREEYYGKAADLFPDIDLNTHWKEEFFKRLSDKYLNKKCDICKNDVPAEGIVLRIDDGREWRVFKSKSDEFCVRESSQIDNGELDIEIEQNDE